jgi:hypothetical protein
MPELIHETPSESELKAYLEEHLASSMLAPFGMTAEELSKSFCLEVGRAFASLKELDGQAFAQRAIDAIFTGLTMMNGFPRGEPFWRGTNCRPTIYKLGEFCQLERIADPRNLTALWAAAILPVWFGSNDFGQEAWVELSRLPEFDLRWPLYAALTIHLTANATEEQVSRFLREANATRESGPILRRIATEGRGLAVPWATQVLQLIGESIQLQRSPQ